MHWEQGTSYNVPIILSTTTTTKNTETRKQISPSAKTWCTKMQVNLHSPFISIHFVRLFRASVFSGPVLWSNQMVIQSFIIALAQRTLGTVHRQCSAHIEDACKSVYHFGETTTIHHSSLDCHRYTRAHLHGNKYLQQERFEWMERDGEFMNNAGKPELGPSCAVVCVWLGTNKLDLIPGCVQGTGNGFDTHTLGRGIPKDLLKRKSFI